MTVVVVVVVVLVVVVVVLLVGETKLRYHHTRAHKSAGLTDLDQFEGAIDSDGRRKRSHLG